MKYFLTPGIVTYLFLITACTICSSKKITCPAFDDTSFTKWFPYKLNQVIHFKNQSTADTFSYVIGYYKLSETYEITRGGGFDPSTDFCAAQGSIYGYNNAAGVGQLSINYQTGERGNVISLSLWNGSWSAGEILQNSFATYGYQVITDSNIVFGNGVTYANLVTLTGDTTGLKDDTAYKLYIAKNAGIIGFEMYPSKQKWILQ